jgi:hypothetical protein
MVVLRAQGVKDGKPMADDLYSLVKSSEFRNAIHGEDFDKAIDAMVRADVATAGRVGPAEFVKMSKYMRSALPGLSDDFLYKYAPELAQEFGGSSAGTSLAAVYQQVVSGQMRTTGLRLLDTLGEIDHSKVDFDKNGRIVKARPGANMLGGVFKNDPAEYAERLIGDMASHGITTESDQRDWMSMIFGNRLSAQMMMTLGYQKLRLDRGAAGISSTLPVDAAAKELLANDPTTNKNNMVSSLTNMLTSLGTITMGPATTFFKDMTDLFNFVRDPQSSSQWHAMFGGGIPLGPLAPSYAWPDAGQFERARRSQDAYKSDPEAARGRALGALPITIPAPQVSMTNNVRVFIDGKAIAATVEAELVGAGFTMGHSLQDSHANYSAPDVSGSGHE